jgi:hypothetical protein
MRAPIVQNIRWTEEGWPAPPLSIAESGNNPLAVGSNADEIAARLGAALARGEGLIRFYNAVKKAGTFSFDALKLT